MLNGPFVLGPTSSVLLKVTGVVPSLWRICTATLCAKPRPLLFAITPELLPNPKGCDPAVNVIARLLTTPEQVSCTANGVCPEVELPPVKAVVSTVGSVTTVGSTATLQVGRTNVTLEVAKVASGSTASAHRELGQLPAGLYSVQV